MDSRRQRLDRLTDRWRARHEARRPRRAGERPPADGEREALARRAFPYRETSPAEYAARHGHEMAGYTYDAYAYSDPELDAWLWELGRELRARREADRG